MKKVINLCLHSIKNPYIFSIFSKVVNIIGGILYTILFSRYLGSSLRGQASIVLNYAELISLVFSLGIYQSYPYFKKYQGDKQDDSLYIKFINYGITFLFIYLICFSIIVILIKPNIKYIIIIFLIPIFVGIRHFNYLVMVENPKIYNIASIQIIFIDILIIYILMISTKPNIVICYKFLIIKELINLLFSIKNLKINIFKIRPTLKGIQPYVKFGFIPMISAILMVINYNLDIIMLEQFGISSSQIGIYSLGVMLAQKLWLIPDAIQQILISRLAGGKTESEVAKVMRMSFMVTFICTLVMVIIGKDLICVLYGNEYKGSYTVTVIIILGVIGMVFYKMIYSYNTVNGMNKINLIILGISAIINIIINIALIPNIGILGAAIASLISYTVCGGLFILHFSKNTEIPIIDMIIIKKDDIKIMQSKFN